MKWEKGRVGLSYEYEKEVEEVVSICKQETFSPVTIYYNVCVSVQTAVLTKMSKTSKCCGVNVVSNQLRQKFKKIKMREYVLFGRGVHSPRKLMMHIALYNSPYFHKIHKFPLFCEIVDFMLNLRILFHLCLDHDVSVPHALHYGTPCFLDSIGNAVKAVIR